MGNIFAALLITAAAPVTGAHMVHHSSGSFEVRMALLAQDDAGGVSIARLTIVKTYEGPLAATAQGVIGSVGGSVVGSGAYVLIERVTGTLDGHAGSFVLAHLGLLDRGKSDQRVVIVPDSGTGALAGIAGSMTIRIEGKAHFYDLDWTLTPARAPPAADR